LDNNTAGVREREGANRTREAGVLDEIQATASFAFLSTFIVHRSSLPRSGLPLASSIG